MVVSMPKDEWGQTKRDYDIAPSVQAVAEERIAKFVEYAAINWQ